MRAIVQAAELARAMREVERASARKGYLPALRNVLLEARPGRLRLVATGPAETLLVMARPFNFVAHLAAIPADEYPTLARDLDLGDWGWLTPSLRMVAA